MIVVKKPKMFFLNDIKSKFRVLLQFKIYLFALRFFFRKACVLRNEFTKIKPVNTHHFIGIEDKQIIKD